MITKRIKKSCSMVLHYWSQLTPIPLKREIPEFVIQSDATEFVISFILIRGSTPCVIATNEHQDIITLSGFKNREAIISNNELYAQYWGISQALVHIKGKIVQSALDNQVALAYIKKGGGSSQQLAKIAWKISKLLVENSIKMLDPIWLPSKLNSIPDALSRIPIPPRHFFPKVRTSSGPIKAFIKGGSW